MKLISEEQTALWRLARQRLELKQLTPTVSSDLVDRFRTQLPTQLKDETLGDLIRRSSTQSKVEIKPFKPKATKQFKPLTEFIRLAADSHDTDMPLPYPESELESADGQFRLKVTESNSLVNIVIQALGFAADQFANRSIGLVDPNDETKLIAEIILDQDGDGSCQLDDSQNLRRTLLNPVIVLID